MSETAEKIVPLRVVPPPSVTGLLTKQEQMPVAQGAKTRAALLEPLMMREQLLVCAIYDALKALQPRAEAGTSDSGWALHGEEKQALLGLLVAFEDTTGCKWTDAVWT